jgi:hypothetical protein
MAAPTQTYSPPPAPAAAPVQTPQAAPQTSSSDNLKYTIRGGIVDSISQDEHHNAVKIEMDSRLDGQITITVNKNSVTPFDDGTYFVTIDGEEVEVTVDDLLKSYQLEQTAQKRLRDVAEDRKKVSSEAQQVEAERKYYAENLALLQDALKQYQTGNRTEQQWADLYQKDPIAYMKAKEDVRDKETKLQALQQEQLALQQKQVETEQVKLLERIPEWKDSEVAQKERSNIVTYAKRFGFNEQEIAATNDSRVVDLLRRAYLFDELQSRKPTATKRVKKAPKMLKAGKPKGKVDTQQIAKKKAFDQLAKSGRKEDAISYLLTK